VVVGERVTMDLGVFRQMSAAPVTVDPAPFSMVTTGAPAPRLLALVSSDLGRVMLYEAQARGLEDLPVGVEPYAAHLQRLREAGYRICVEE
jgi:hypothetical protein